MNGYEKAEGFERDYLKECSAMESGNLDWTKLCKAWKKQII